MFGKAIKLQPHQVHAFKSKGPAGRRPEVRQGALMALRGSSESEGPAKDQCYKGPVDI